MSDNISKSCIFCGILAGHQPSAEVYQDDEFIVLMDKYPVNPGHTLVIPKKHYDNLLVMPPYDVGRLYSLSSIISTAVVTAIRADGFNIGQNNGKAANQIVPHVHVHIIPRFDGDSLNGRWPTRRVASMDELQTTAQKIRTQINPSLIASR